MKKTKTVATLLIMVLLMALLAGCSSPAPQATPQPEGTPQPEAQSAATPDAGKTYQIGIIQLVEHPALDAAHDGFVDALTANGYIEGADVEYDFQNAQGDMSNLSTIGDRFVSRNVDLILSITTDATQAVAGKTTSIPILGTAVTSYTATGLVDSEEHPGGNISGTSDMNPVAAQIDLLVELVPGMETVGLIYNSSEKNSVLQADIAKAHVEKIGLKWQQITVTNANDIQQAMQSLVNKCEGIYIPTDNTLASAMPTVHSVAGEARIPTVCGESNMVMGGGLATMGIDYYQLGYKTGLMAIEVLNGADPATMPIQYADSSNEIIINGLVAEEIDYTVPEKYAACVVYPE